MSISATSTARSTGRAAWPDELDQVNHRIAEHDFLLLGRTARAMASLPEAQRETERLINLLFARTTGGLDLRGDRLDEPGRADRHLHGRMGLLTARHRGAIRARAHVTDIGFHAEWPLIARDTPGLRCAYLPCEGLEYETADRYSDQIAAAGGIDCLARRAERRHPPLAAAHHLHHPDRGRHCAIRAVAQIRNPMPIHWYYTE